MSATLKKTFPVVFCARCEKLHRFYPSEVGPDYICRADFMAPVLYNGVYAAPSYGAQHRCVCRTKHMISFATGKCIVCQNAPKYPILRMYHENFEAYMRKEGVDALSRRYLMNTFPETFFGVNPEALAALVGEVSSVYPAVLASLIVDFVRL